MSRAFRFEPLLDRAEQREEQQTLALAAALQQEQDALEALRAIVEERERQLEHACTRTRVIDTVQRQAALAFVASLEARIEAQRGVVQAARARVEAERGTLLDVARERRSLEHLRDQDAARALEAEERREAGRVDDLNMARHARQDRSVLGETGAA